jgi:hypothetical protein
VIFGRFPAGSAPAGQIWRVEGVELNFIDPQMGCAYMYVHHKGNRTVPSFSFWQNKRMDGI